MNWQQRNLAGGKLIFRSLLGKWLDFRDIGRRERYALQGLGEGGFFNIFLDKLDSGWEFMAREAMRVRGFLARAENIINSLIQFQ